MPLIQNENQINDISTGLPKKEPVTQFSQIEMKMRTGWSAFHSADFQLNFQLLYYKKRLCS